VLYAIEALNISKSFRLHHERHSSVKDRILHPGGGTHTDFEALRDVSFSVEEGEMVGILGRNGSGKSTLLKTICGVLQPSSGEVRLRGTLAGLLELGAGFQPDLSGRDNVYLSASLLGLSRRTVDHLFDEIVAFAELENFIDTPVKFYSSGMYVRLGFAVAVNVNPDILVIDEVLAVGDERFQAKCMDRIHQLKADGRTILLVSHNADQIRALCNRAIVLDHGVLVADGSAGDSVRIFRERLLGEAPTVTGGDAATVVAISTVTTPTGRFDARSGQAWALDVVVQSETSLTGHFVMEIRSESGALVVRTDPTGSAISLIPGEQRLSVRIPAVHLLSGRYEVAVGITNERGIEVLAWRDQAAVLEVVYDGRATGLVDIQLDVTVY